MALSLALHGLAVLFLLAAGAAGSSTDQEPALFVEMALVTPAPNPADEPATPEQETAAIELAPPEEPPPVDLSELKPVELPKPEPPPPPKPEPQQQRQASKAVAPKRVPTQEANAAAGDARQATHGLLPTPAIVWEGKPSYRQPPTPAVYPSRAIELHQQGEVLVRVRLDPEGSAVEVLIHRSSGFDLLDRSALTAVRGWRFLPAMRDGRPVAAWVEIPVRFQLR